MVVPESGKIDASLARQLNRRIQRDGKTVWLCCDVAETRAAGSDALTSDAVCVPVRDAAQFLFGTLQTYRGNEYFTDADVRFCEALAGFLGRRLRHLRHTGALYAHNASLRHRLVGADELIGDGDAMCQLRQMVADIAQRNTPVLIEGEYGTGKELVAATIHQRSAFSSGPMITVNCGTEDLLLEADLFGDRLSDGPCLLQQADEGAIYFDEIAELSAECQNRLVQLLKNRSFRPNGSDKDHGIKVRLIAATQQDLQAQVEAGHFSQELFDLLSRATVRVPALREHPEDIAMLAQYYLDKLGIHQFKQFRLTDAAIDKLRASRWPGNIRQLRAVLECASICARTNTIDVEDLESRL
jgi:DNA-binding NtrC family response regulator